jgi:hypothetical protein
VLERSPAIVREAGAIAAGRCGTAFRRWEKAPGSPVCDIDLEVDAFLRERLTALDPEAGWLSEETLDAPTGSSGRGCGWSIRSTAPATICAAARLVRVGGPGRGAGAADRSARRAGAGRALDRGQRASAPGATASGCGSAAGAISPGRGFRPTSCRGGRRSGRGRQAQFDRASNRHGRGGRGRSGRDFALGLRVGHRRRRPDRRRGGRDGQRRARPAARLQQRQRRGVRSAGRDSRIHAAAAERLRERAMDLV